MKFFLLLLLSVSFAAPSNSCEFRGKCNFENLRQCNLGFSEDQVEAACRDAAINFSAASGTQSHHFDDTYMDGGGLLNDFTGRRLIKLTTSRLKRFRNNINEKSQVLWPEYESLQGYVDIGKQRNQRPYLSNFNLTSSCQLKSAMCCFSSGRQNADVCNHNYEDSKRSNHLAHGYGIYDNQRAQCVGFMWDDDTDYYKGNLLFDVSYGTFLDQGDKQGVPGAPLCGCLEQMPAVTNAECKSINVNQEPKYKASRDGSRLKIELVEGGRFSFSNCGGQSLQQAYDASSSKTDAEKTKVKTRHLVESCETSKRSFLNRNFWVPSDGTPNPFTRPDPSKWEKVAGQGLDFMALKNYLDLDARDANFRALLSASPNGIVYRQCGNCLPDYQHIYYRRINPTLPKENFLDYFLNSWKETDNELGVDFELYSNYQDAVQRAPNAKWTYCNYNDANVGFPRDCAPTKGVVCQWNNYNGKKKPCGGAYVPYTTAFYVEK